MLRCLLASLAAMVLITVCLIPDDCYARRVPAGCQVGGGRFRIAAYRGANRGEAYGLGAAAVGAAAAGAYGYYGGYNSCTYDTYGNYVCPGQYPYGYRY